MRWDYEPRSQVASCPPTMPGTRFSPAGPMSSWPTAISLGKGSGVLNRVDVRTAVAVASYSSEMPGNMLQAGRADLVLADRQFSLVEMKNEYREIQ